MITQLICGLIHYYIASGLNQSSIKSTKFSIQKVKTGAYWVCWSDFKSLHRVYFWFKILFKSIFVKSARLFLSPKRNFGIWNPSAYLKSFLKKGVQTQYTTESAEYPSLGPFSGLLSQTTHSFLCSILKLSYPSF